MNVSTQKTLTVIKMVDELARQTGITLFNLKNINDDTLQPLIEKTESFLEYLEAVENSVTASLDLQALPSDHDHTNHDNIKLSISELKRKKLELEIMILEKEAFPFGNEKPVQESIDKVQP